LSKLFSLINFLNKLRRIKMRKLFYVTLVGLLALLVLPGAVSAADDTGSVPIVANIGNYIDLTVTGTLGTPASPWSLSVGGLNENTDVIDANVKSTSNYELKVMDALTDTKPAGTEGKMAEWSGSAYVVSGKVLTNAFQVKAGSEPQGYKTLSGTNQIIADEDATVLAGDNFDIGLKQNIVVGDTTLPSNDYRIVVTFTASNV
jgi:hypothetical protein